ncbi:APC family permease [Rhodococcus sp. IEGM 1366]|uniref:APC family permease n=1 Tax=Rhodococcus sp. IEGM 1366 TaxID=3082223 RepID=UPI002953458E|nr:APC family permease [Rhodococcus sp. IEGM 1366]MDV8070681.1 APC family permease [Rhodococcus sp. IEGM 1366]
MISPPNTTAQQTDTQSTSSGPPLKTPSLVLFGIAYMAPAVVLATFGVISVASNGSSASSYLLATTAMLLTALSYATLSRRFQLSGSAYSYVRRVLGPNTGFLAGWVLILDYLFLPMVIWLIGASFLSAQFPGVPMWVWIVIQAIVVSAVNVFGIKLADRLNTILLTFVTLVLIVFVALSLQQWANENTSVSVLSPFWNSDSSILAITAGAAIASYSFLGFDAITTLTGEAANPKHSIPRAIVITTLTMGAVFTIVSFAAELVASTTIITDQDSAAFDIGSRVGGNFLASAIVAALVVGGFASAIAAQAGSSRLLLAMGRDGVLLRNFFGYVHPVRKTPVLNIALTGLVGLTATQMTLTSSTSFINFGAFTAFTVVNVCAIVLAWRSEGSGQRRWGKIFVASVASIVTLFLLFNLDGNALLFGSSWLVIGTIYLAVLTRGFRKEPPELALDEASS